MNIIKLNDLTRWNILKNGASIAFNDGPARRVRVVFNAAAATCLYISHKAAPKEINLLTVIPDGLSVVEFMTSGAFQIAAEADGVVQYQTAEHEEACFEGDGETFTTIAERAPRNEALEYVMYQAEVTANRREAALRAEFANQIAALKGSTDERGIHGGKAAERPQPDADDDDEGGAPSNEDGQGRQGNEDGGSGGTPRQRKPDGAGKAAKPVGEAAK